MKKKVKNEPFSSITHFIGLLLAIIGLVFMIINGKTYGTTKHLIGFSIFGISMILLYSSSTLYHYFPRASKIKNIFQRIDHAMVFVLMAGTYTPLCLTMYNRTCGWALLATVWIIATTGIILKIKGVKMKESVSMAIYTIFGLLLLTAIQPISEYLPKNALHILYGGGSLYLIGLIFYRLDDFVPRKLFGMHEIWHLFVLGGNFSHVFLMIHYVLYT